jgi:hypothetical protein
MPYLTMILGVFFGSMAAGDVLGMRSLERSEEPGEMDQERLEADNTMMINGMAAVVYGLVMVL